MGVLRNPWFWAGAVVAGVAAAKFSWWGSVLYAVSLFIGMGYRDWEASR